MFHKIIILGRLGRDPELRYTATGSPVANFSVAANRRYTAQEGQRVEETIWFRVSAWGKLAEVVHQFLRKGMAVYVEGRLIPDLNTGSPRIYQRRDGTAGASYEVRAETLRILSERRDANEANTATAEIAATTDPVVEEDIPF